MDACDTGLQLDHDRANPVDCLSQVGSGHSGVWVETAAQKQDLVITLLRSLESPQAFISSLLEALLVRVAACKPTWSLQFLQNSVGTCYSCFLVREKRQGKDKYETAMRKNQRRTEVKAGEEKQHGKYLLCMSTREVISTTLLQTRTLEQGEGNWRCAAMVTQTLSALGRKVRMRWLSCESALPHPSLCPIMVVKQQLF